MTKRQREQQKRGSESKRNNETQNQEWHCYRRKSEKKETEEGR